MSEKTGKALVARKGKIYTNGEDYGYKIFLADGVSADDFYEIPVEEYEKILAEREVKQL